jgi:hypothetical protein
MDKKARTWYVSVICLLLTVFVSSVDGVCSCINYYQPEINIKYVFPLKEERGERYLSDSNGQPFFWLGDAAWSMIAQLNDEDVSYYMYDRAGKGFSVLLVSLIEHKFSSHAPANYNGDLPFTGRPFATPNEKYFTHADFVIREAAKYNIIILLDPLYLGYDCKDEGWCAEVRQATTEELYAWGKFIGSRYRNFDNIIWCIGGDTDPTAVREKVLETVRGIRESDKVHLFSAHNQPGSMAISPWKGEKWLTVNNVYSYDTVIYRHHKEAWMIEPAMPFFLIETVYENEHNSTPVQLRAQAYQAVLSGAMGYIFGNCPIWHFGSFPAWCKPAEWKTELNNEGSTDMAHFQRLFRSRSWFRLIPDFDHKVIASGFGTWGTKDYVTSACTSDGNTIIAYLSCKNEITADLRKIKGDTAVCWWFNPSNGEVTSAGNFKTYAFQTFIPPGENDWVLVIDSDSPGFQPPVQIK